MLEHTKFHLGYSKQAAPTIEYSRFCLLGKTCDFDAS